jgi:hypothetical protein
MAERLKATDCKSVLSGVRRFEPCSAHIVLRSFSEGERTIKFFYFHSTAKTKERMPSFAKASEDMRE